jgi:hypothetical protein
MVRSSRASWEKEFVDFVSSDAPSEVPVEISQKLFSEVSKELNPSVTWVFAKTTLIQLFGGVVSLLFCPQFGIGISEGQGLMPFLMKFGEGVCMLGCGALFGGFGLLAASFLLRPEEIRILKASEVLILGALATLSLGAFICLGANVVLTIGLIWILGTLVGSATIFEAGWALRKKIHLRTIQ